MVIYSPIISTRLQYIADFISDNLFGAPATLTNNKTGFAKATGVKINYSDEVIPGAINIIPQGLLFEKDIREQVIDCFPWEGSKAFFKSERCCTDASATTGYHIATGWPFDIFAASFYLLSRYEEYLPHKKDEYGLYAHENSIAYKESFLHLPLINEWLLLFAGAINNQFSSFTIHHPIAIGSPFTFIPTYDIDIAWSYKHKGWKRQTAGIIRSLFKLNTGDLLRRWQVARGRRADPFDAYDWLHELHDKYQLKPYYFFLVPKKNRGVDKNILPHKKAMKELIAGHAERYHTGIHPSWQSGDDDNLLHEEILRLSSITGRPVLFSRQHYLRFALPETYRQLIANGIKAEFSMGYGTINGFRASVATPFYWYDLEKDHSTELLIYPFCFMDANAYYVEKKNAKEALAELQTFFEVVKKVDGMFIMIWHNQFLGTDPAFCGWKEMYQQFIEDAAKRR